MTVNAPQRPRYREPDPKYMTFVEHLGELRQRLIISFLAILVGSIFGYIVANRVIRILEAPLCAALRRQDIGTSCKLIVDQPYGSFTLTLKIAIMVGFAIALPVTLYQLYAFVAPAFGAGVHRWAPLWITSALVLFAAGVVVGYFVIPLALNFFVGYQTVGVRYLPFATSYINFLALILFVFGLSFELPLVLVSLTALGVTSSRWLGAHRLYFFFGIFIAATVITPGADFISPLVLGGIMYVLFEASMVVSRLFGK